MASGIHGPRRATKDLRTIGTSWASTVFGAVPAARVCAFSCKAERTQMNDVVVTYFGEQVSVPKEVAYFLEQDRKRAQAQDKQDQRHLSKSAYSWASPR